MLEIVCISDGAKTMTFFSLKTNISWNKPLFALTTIARYPLSGPVTILHKSPSFWSTCLLNLRSTAVPVSEF